MVTAASCDLEHSGRVPGHCCHSAISAAAAVMYAGSYQPRLTSASCSAMSPMSRWRSGPTAGVPSGSNICASAVSVAKFTPACSAQPASTLDNGLCGHLELQGGLPTLVTHGSASSRRFTRLAQPAQCMPAPTYNARTCTTMGLEGSSTDSYASYRQHPARSLPEGQCSRAQH